MNIKYPKILIDSIENGHMLIDDKFTVHYWNKWLEINTQIPYTEIVEKNLKDFYPDLNYNVLGRKIRTALKLGTPSFYDHGSSTKFIPINRNKVTTSSLTLMQQQITISPYISNEGLVMISIYDISELHETKLLLQKEVEKVNNLNSELENRVQEALEANKKQIQQMIIQSRQAQMGEMICIIAHQWKQPLSLISATTMHMQTLMGLGKLNSGADDNEYLFNQIATIDDCVRNLSTIIDDFRNFYKPNKSSDIMTLEDICLKSLAIIKQSLIVENIKVIEDYSDKEKLEVYSNELIQVVLNLLKNAQDNFIEKNIEKPSITITVKDKTISICDNGGGIKEDIVDKIFDPYFSTKHEDKGTGIGLYMSKTIIEEHHNGKLKAINTDDGVCFVIELGTISENILLDEETTKLI